MKHATSHPARRVLAAGAPADDSDARRRRFAPLAPSDLPGRMAAHVIEDDACWLWIGAIQTNGYGSTTDGTGRSMLAHRRAYEALVRSIPDGLTLDHLCRRRACVNPAHLEPVTATENQRRARGLITHCPAGHAYTPENTRTRLVNGYERRECKACRARHSRDYRARTAALRAGGAA